MLYLKKYRLGIGLFFLFVLVFFVIFALYGLPLGAVFYPALVFFVLGGALVLLDIAAQKRRHRLLALSLIHISRAVGRKSACKAGPCVV